MEHKLRQITVGDCIIVLTTGHTENGQPFISLGGINCDLEGMEPGLYNLMVKQEAKA